MWLTSVVNIGVSHAYSAQIDIAVNLAYLQDPVWAFLPVLANGNFFLS